MMNYEFALEHLEATIKQWYKENVDKEILDNFDNWFKIEIITNYKNKILLVKDLTSPIATEKLKLKTFHSPSIRLMYEQVFAAYPTGVKI